MRKLKSLNLPQTSLWAVLNIPRATAIFPKTPIRSVLPVGIGDRDKRTYFTEPGVMTHQSRFIMDKYYNYFNGIYADLTLSVFL